MDIKQEEKLVEKIKNDRSQFKALYEAYMPDLYRYAYSMTYNKEKAEDIASETFAIAIEKIDQFVWTGRSVKAWLITIARNYTYKEYAKEKWLSADIELSEDKEISPENRNVNETDLVEDVSKYLALLPDSTREIISLKIWEEFTFAQIGEIIGSKESTVKMEFYRGLEKMKQEMVKDGIDEKRTLFPIIFASVGKLGDSEIYSLPSELLSKEFISKLLNLEAMSKPVKILLGVTAGIVVTAATIIGSYYGARYYQENFDDDSERNESQDQSSDEGDTGVDNADTGNNNGNSTGSNDGGDNGGNEPVEEDPYEGWEYYHSDNFDLGFYYPEEFKVHEDIVNGSPYIYLRIIGKHIPSYPDGVADFNIVEIMSTEGVAATLEPTEVNPSEMSLIEVGGVEYIFSKFVIADGGMGGFSKTTTYLIEFENLDPLMTMTILKGESSGDGYEIITSEEELQWGRLVLESIVFDAQ